MGSGCSQTFVCHWTALTEGCCGPGVYLQQHNLKPGDCIAIKRTYDDLLHIVINPEAPADVREVTLPNPVASVMFAFGTSQMNLGSAGGHCA